MRQSFVKHHKLINTASEKYCSKMLFSKHNLGLNIFLELGQFFQFFSPLFLPDISNSCHIFRLADTRQTFFSNFFII